MRTDNSEPAEDEGESSSWREVSGPPRRMETITFGPQAQQLKSDVEAFLLPEAQATFRARLLPYQRCYLLWGPPGNGKSSVLQALSIKFGLKLYFFRSYKTMKKEDLEQLLGGPMLNSTMICIEDAESAFQSEEDIAKLEEEQRQAQLVADRSAGAAGAGSDDAASGGGGGRGAGQPPQLVSAKTFQDIISGEGMSAPSKRLIFFSTNHVDKMPLELLRLVDQQGARTEFPNANLTQCQEMFDLFFREEDFDAFDEAGDEAPEPNEVQCELQRAMSAKDIDAAASCTVEELRQHRADFIQALSSASWYDAGASTVSGASLSEFFQRHRDSPARAVANVSGADPDCLQSIVEKSRPTASLATRSGGRAPAAGGQEIPEGVPEPQQEASTPLQRSLSERVYNRFGLQSPYVFAMALMPVYVFVGVECAIQRSPLAMAALAGATIVAQSVSTSALHKIGGAILVVALCSFDCDGDSTAWVLDPVDDTLLCVEYSFSSVKRSELFMSYAQPKLAKLEREVWATIPMALVTALLIVAWLSLSFLRERLSSYLWVRFSVGLRNALHMYVIGGMWRQHRTGGFPRLSMAQEGITDKIDRVGKPKLRTTNVSAAALLPVFLTF